MTGPLTLLVCLAIAGGFIGFGFLVGRAYERMFPGAQVYPPNRHPSFHHRPSRPRSEHARLRLVSSPYDFDSEEGA